MFSKEIKQPEDLSIQDSGCIIVLFYYCLLYRGHFKLKQLFFIFVFNGDKAVQI